MCTKFARSPYVAASSCTESVMGPQNLLTQNTGVETTTIVGRPVATASATVSWCSSGSGTDPSSSARESTALTGASGSPGNRLAVRGAEAPAVTLRCSGPTSKAALASIGSPLTVPLTVTDQTPGTSTSTTAPSYTPTPPISAPRPGRDQV